MVVLLTNEQARDKNEAIKVAREQAMKQNRNMVVFEGKAGEWHVYSVQEFNDLGGFDLAAIYVLPTGEVTRRV